MWKDVLVESHNEILKTLDLTITARTSKSMVPLNINRSLNVFHSTRGARHSKEKLIIRRKAEYYSFFYFGYLFYIV